MKTIFDNFIIIGTIIATILIIITLLVWYIRSINKKINKLMVVQKYYDIMLIKYCNLNPQKKKSGYLVFDDDLKVFDEKENKYLMEYFKDVESMEIFYKGTNKTFGQFH